MKGNKAIIGVFSYLDDVLQAVKSVKETGRDFNVYAPTYIPELEQAVSRKRSGVAKIVLTGAVAGCIFGFALAILCGLDWPLRTSAKEIISIPGYVVIGYECTILFGALSTLLAIFHFCRLPDIFRKVGYDPRFSHDKFGVVVGCSSTEIETVKATLENAGAEEIEVRDGL